MITDRPETERNVDTQLEGIAARLIDIAGCVASEAEMAAAAIRSLIDHADRVAALAARLEAAAGAMEEDARRQADELALARSGLATNKPIIEALEQSVSGVSTISTAIATIAQESRILSLNARIEAARADDGQAFAVVATEMSTLAMRTVQATTDIGERALLLAHDVGAANKVVAAHATLVLEQEEVLAASLENATQQRDAAGQLALITTDTVGTIGQAALAIGRVGANSVAVKVLARQLAKLAG